MPEPGPTQTRPEKPRPTYNSGPDTADEKSLGSKKPSPQFNDQKAIDDKKKVFSVIWWGFRAPHALGRQWVSA